MAFLFQCPVCNGDHLAGAVPQWCHLLLGEASAGRRGSPQGGGAAVAGPVGSGVYAAVGRRPLKVVVAVQLRFCALSTVIPLLITVSTGGIAGECIAAGMAGVVAVGLQKKQQNFISSSPLSQSYKSHHCGVGALLPGGIG